MSLGIPQPTEAVEQVELSIGKEPLGLSLLEQKLNGCPFKIIPTRHSKEASEHVLDAHLGQENAGKE